MHLSRYRFRWLGAAAVAAALLAAGAVSTASSSAAAAGCSVTYTVSSQWPGGFNANVAITNLGSPLSSWTLTWDFAAGQRVTQGWSATYTQTGAQVTAASASWDGNLATGGSTTIGFNGSWNNVSNPAPADFALNGVSCTGSVSGSPSPTPSPSSPTPSPSSPSPSPTPTPAGSLPSSFQWSSSGVLISPHSDSHNIIAVKDPSVVYYNGQWYVAASTVNSSGSYGMEFIHFSDWSQANAATPVYADQTAIGAGYKTAPMLFYFTPQKLWYVVYQTGSNAGYSTNPDITNPAGWSATQYFYSGMPPIISQNIGSGYWVDMWVICDSANCYLFSMDDNGHLYRSQTSVASFPSGMSQPVIAASNSTPSSFFEADNVYKVAGSNEYLLIVEAIGSDGRRYFTSYTSNAIDGTWTSLASTQSNPFARWSNTTFSGTPWTQDISSGEMIRSGYDQTLTISPCRIQYLYQGHDPSASGSYNSLPWRLGLLTQTNSTC
ncbi:MAG: cellulose binding domain-containing protein [Streptosporangiaceae bacterium]|nr:cellulose binding domain-containing protein [Streptosporangiaceae bacterium]MBV9855605.1 cellulose binding domain-containing protein [Streptosporangiaceae bacterium]